MYFIADNDDNNNNQNESTTRCHDMKDIVTTPDNNMDSIDGIFLLNLNNDILKFNFHKQYIKVNILSFFYIVTFLQVNILKVHTTHPT